MSRTLFVRGGSAIEYDSEGDRILLYSWWNSLMDPHDMPAAELDAKTFFQLVDLIRSYTDHTLEPPI